MHQIYIQSTNKNQANNDIAEIQSIISKTYRYIEAVEGYFAENELLNNYCNLFFNIGGNIEKIKEKLNKEENKTQWIKLFFENFVELTHSAKSIVTNSAKSIVTNKNQADIITNLFFVGNKANWKLVFTRTFLQRRSIRRHIPKDFETIRSSLFQTQTCQLLSIGSFAKIHEAIF